MKLKKVFEDLLNNKNEHIENCNSGKSFENKFKEICQKHGIEILNRDDNEIKKILEEIKEDILNDESDFLENKYNITGIVKEPYNTQSYPDFLLFTNDKIIPIEIKFTSKSLNKPMWNGSLPKMSGIYVFGKKGNNPDLTFFMGRDLLTNNERKKLKLFWDKIKKLQEEFEKELLEDEKFENKYGFDVYLRKTFNQNKKTNKIPNLNFFDKDLRKKHEQNVMDFLSKIN